MDPGEEMRLILPVARQWGSIDNKQDRWLCAGAFCVLWHGCLKARGSERRDIQRVMGHFDACPCAAPPTENRNHGGKGVTSCFPCVLRSPMPVYSRCLVTVSREWVDWRGLSKGLNMISLYEMSHKCRRGSGWEGWGLRKWEIRQLLQPPRASLAGAEGTITFYHLPCWFGGEAGIILWNPCMQISVVMELFCKSPFPPQEHREHSVQHAVCKSRASCCWKGGMRKSGSFHVMLFLEIPTQRTVKMGKMVSQTAAQ